jgi:hypothetical protein
MKRESLRETHEKREKSFYGNLRKTLRRREEEESAKQQTNVQRVQHVFDDTKRKKKLFLPRNSKLQAEVFCVTKGFSALKRLHRMALKA